MNLKKLHPFAYFTLLGSNKKLSISFLYVKFVKFSDDEENNKLIIWLFKMMFNFS